MFAGINSKCYITIIWNPRSPRIFLSSSVYNWKYFFILNLFWRAVYVLKILFLFLNPNTICWFNLIVDGGFHISLELRDFICSALKISIFSFSLGISVNGRASCCLTCKANFLNKFGYHFCLHTSLKFRICKTEDNMTLDCFHLTENKMFCFKLY